VAAGLSVPRALRAHPHAGRHVQPGGGEEAIPEEESGDEDEPGAIGSVASSARKRSGAERTQMLTRGATAPVLAPLKRGSLVFAVAPSGVQEQLQPMTRPMSSSVVSPLQPGLSPSISNMASMSNLSEAVAASPSASSLPQTATTAAAASAAPAAATATAAAAEQASPVKEKQALPPNWSSFVDPSTGNTYYYNTVTKERWVPAGARQRKARSLTGGAQPMDASHRRQPAARRRR
jgi:hypothetical protein